MIQWIKPVVAAQVAAKDAGDDEAMFFDSDYIKALSYACRPLLVRVLGVIDWSCC